MEGFWAECEVLMNEDFDLCLFSIDQDVVYRNDIPFPQAGEILMVIDTIIPMLTKQLETMKFSKKALLIHNKNKKESQQE